MPNFWRLAAIIGSAATAAALAAAPATAAAGGCPGDAVVSYPPGPASDRFGGPFGITQGPGGTWYADVDHIVQISHDRQHKFPLPGDANAGWLAWDGVSSVIWFADRNQGRIGTIDGQGHIREYQIPDGPTGTALPHAFVFGPGPDVWFTDQVNDRIGRLDLDTDTMTFYQVPTPDAGPQGMTRGNDGALYFTERAANQIGRLAPDGTFTEWPLAAGSSPQRITIGPDGNIWFTELLGGQLGRIDPSGTITIYPIDGGPVGMTRGPDGQLYVALFFAHQVARVSTAGVVTATWPVPGALQIGTSRDSLWATDGLANSVSQVRVQC